MAEHEPMVKFASTDCATTCEHEMHQITSQDNHVVNGSRRDRFLEGLSSPPLVKTVC
jgi:hypothetical protein